MKVSFSLSKTSKPSLQQQQPLSLKKPAVFSALEDDIPGSEASVHESAKLDVNKRLAAQNVYAETSKATRKKIAAEMEVDATVYEYDEVWDKMQEAKSRQEKQKEVDAKERKPKYIAGLLTSAATRRLDHLRAEEKMIQREREAEGDEFKDKESFVTQAYKDQMVELRKAEEEEKKREEMEKQNKSGFTTGMSHFYRKLLEESESKHDEAVAATTRSTKVIGPQGPNLTVTKPPELMAKTDVALAREAKEQGKDVELNDDNRIVDKRELLSAGLNLGMANTRKLGLRTPTAGTQNTPAEVLAHRAVGTAASKKDISQRRRREIETQLEEATEQLLKENEQREKEALARVVMKRNTEEDVQSARERYLARKRQKFEEAASIPSQDGTNPEPS